MVKLVAKIVTYAAKILTYPYFFINALKLRYFLINKRNRTNLNRKTDSLQQITESN